MTDLGQILAKVVQRTEEGKLKWRRTGDSGRFITAVDAISIEVEEGLFYDNVVRSLNILDELGDTVESLATNHFEATPDQKELLAHLFLLARRSALDVEATLEKLAKALEP